MQEHLKFYIDGKWVDPVTPKTLEVINPATEEPFARISLGSKADVDKAVAAAKRAFASFSRTTKQERIELIQAIMAAYQKRLDDVAQAISEEMGAPMWLAKAAQGPSALAHGSTLEALKNYEFETARGKNRIVPRAGRRRRHDHAVELADQPDRLQGRSGARSGAARWCSSPARSRR